MRFRIDFREIAKWIWNHAGITTISIVFLDVFSQNLQNQGTLKFLMLFAIRLHGDGQKSIETTRFIRFSWLFPCRQRASRKHRNPNGLLMFLSNIFRQGWEQQPQRQRIIKDFDVSVMPLHGTGANKENIVFLMVFYTFLRFQGSGVISRSKFRGGVETGLGGSKSHSRNHPGSLWLSTPGSFW